MHEADHQDRSGCVHFVLYAFLLAKLVNYTIEVLEDMTGEEFRQVTGYVKNKAGKSIELLEINITFYDDDKNFILTKSSYIRDISKEQIKEFSTVYHSNTPHYYIVNWENIEFEITVHTK